MTTSNILTTLPEERDRMDSINMSDLEGQYHNINNTETNVNNNNLPLRGILKKPELNASIENDAVRFLAMKICITLIIIIIMLPIIVADLHFGYTDDSCINDHPKNLNISMKLYLVISGFVGLGSMIGLIINICCISTNNDLNFINLLCTGFILYAVGFFYIIWNILGAIVFWGTIYKEGNCDKNVSTYLYVSLIIKIISNLFGILQNYSQNKK